MFEPVATWNLDISIVPRPPALGLVARFKRPDGAETGDRGSGIGRGGRVRRRWAESARTVHCVPCNRRSCGCWATKANINRVRLGVPTAPTPHIKQSSLGTLLEHSQSHLHLHDPSSYAQPYNTLELQTASRSSIPCLSISETKRRRHHPPLP